MWVARDKDKTLWLFEEYPSRHTPNFLKKWWNWCKDSDFYWMQAPTGFYTIIEDYKYPQFKNITWEDEPVEVDFTFKSNIDFNKLSGMLDKALKNETFENYERNNV